MIIALLAVLRPAMLESGPPDPDPDVDLLLLSGDEQTGVDYLQISYSDELAGPDQVVLSGDFE